MAGRAGQSRAGQGRAGQGRAGRGRGATLSPEETIIRVSAWCNSAVQCNAVQDLKVSVEEEIARGHVRAVRWPVFPLPSPAREDPGTKDAVDHGHGSVESVDGGTVRRKKMALPHFWSPSTPLMSGKTSSVRSRMYSAEL